MKPLHIDYDHIDDRPELLLELEKACKLLKKVSKYLCADDPEQGDYCRCSAYVGRGEAHKSSCDYIKIKRFLNRK